ncbi:MAG: DUF5788 family protein [Methanocellales archaeon]
MVEKEKERKKEKEEKREVEEDRATPLEIAVLLHSAFFGIVWSHYNMVEDLEGRIYIGSITQLPPILHREGFKVDRSKKLEDSLREFAEHLQNKEFFDFVEFRRLDENRFVFEIDGCALAKNGIHEMLTRDVCPFALIAASMLYELAEKPLYIAASEFTVLGSRTILEMPRAEEEEIFVKEFEKILAEPEVEVPARVSPILRKGVKGKIYTPPEDLGEEMVVTEPIEERVQKIMKEMSRELAPSLTYKDITKMISALDLQTAGIGARVPDYVTIGGKDIELRKLIWRLLRKDKIPRETLAATRQLAGALYKEVARKKEEIKAIEDLSKPENVQKVIRLKKDAMGLIRAIEYLESFEKRAA